MALTDGLVGNWHMNNNWLDSSGQGNNGTAFGAIFNGVDQKLGSHAGSFDGIDDYVDLGTSSTLNVQFSEFTIGTWFKIPSIPANKQLPIYASTPNNSGGFTLTINPSDINFIGLGLQKTYVGISISYTFNSNTWYHIVAVQKYSGGSPSQVNFYVNGSLIGSVAHTGNYYSSSGQNKNIGKGYTPHGLYPFPGLIDELAVWNRAITAAEVTELWNGGAGVEIGGSAAPKYTQLERGIRGLERGLYGG